MGQATFTIKALNLLLAPTMAGRSLRVDKAFDKLIATAEAATGAKAADHEQFLADARFVLRAWAGQDHASAIGWASVSGSLQTRITNRFRVARAIAEHPEIEDEPIEAPVVVIGLPRTATTHTHNLLAHPAGNRAPLLWEMFNTLPPGADEALVQAAIKDAQDFIGTYDKAAPVFGDIHKMDAMLPDECIFLLPFHIFLWGVCGPMEGARQWRRDRDFTEDYRFLKQALQVMQYGRERKRWVLKTPCHLWALPTLVATFPGAQLVWNHRDPATVVASYCSLMEVGWSVQLRKYDPAHLGATCLELLTEANELALAARADLPLESVIDVGYSQLTDDARTQVPLLFERLGLTWDDRESAHLEHRLGRPDQKRGHEYDLARFGLEADQVEQAFGDYAQMVSDLPTFTDPRGGAARNG
jgi:hypothetical protein